METIFSNIGMWEPLLRHLRGKSVGVILPEGNVGDEFILLGTKSLFQRAGIHAVFVNQHNIEALPPVEVVAWGGGGNVSGRYKRHEAVKKGYEMAQKYRASYICFPQSIEMRTDRLRFFDKIFLREVVSVNMEPHSVLIPDLALASQLTEAKPEMEFQQVFRSDRETTGMFQQNDPRDKLTILDFIKLAGRASHLETDLLHLAVCALLQGVRVTLRPCDWHKNEAMYRTWLHYFPLAEYKEI